MEYQNLSYGLIGLLATLMWALSYFNFLRKSPLFLPKKMMKKSQGLSFRNINFFIGLVAWLLISYAMTLPRKPLASLPSDIEVNDVFLVVDVSRSMLADDLKPNRLEVAKQKLREFAALRPTDRLGVIVFSEKVFTMLPLTTDPQLIDSILSDIKVGYFGSGTNIGDALALAVARAQASQTKNKVIILLTDGVNNVGNMTPSQAAELAKEYKIKVYTIGLGGKKSAKIPFGNSAFGQRYQTIPGGSIDTKTLEEISSTTGGKSYMADTEGSLEEILGEIQELEKTQIKDNNKVVYQELYYGYLLWGVLLLLFSDLTRKFYIREGV